MGSLTEMRPSLIAGDVRMGPILGLQPYAGLEAEMHSPKDESAVCQVSQRRYGHEPRTASGESSSSKVLAPGITSYLELGEKLSSPASALAGIHDS